MKRFLRAIIPLILFLACLSPFLLPEFFSPTAQPPEEYLVGISREAFHSETPLVSLSQWEEEQELSVYHELESEIHYQNLSSAEKTVYRLLEACRDSASPYLFIDSRLLAECDRSFSEILIFLSLDSPLVEQNLSHSRKDYSRRWKNEENQSVSVSGKIFHVRRFASEYWDKKLEALEEARRIVADAPSLPQLELARHFYQILTQTVAYTAYEEKEEPHYLYDALVGKRAQCDGFANAFSLLCNLAQIPCLEKVYEAPNPEEAGHTWNSFCAGSVWYNADCSLSEGTAEDEKRLNFCSRFGFSDSLQSNVNSYEGIAPPCMRDLIPLALSVTSPRDTRIAKTLWQMLVQGEADVVLVCLETAEFDEKSLQNLADSARLSIEVVGFSWNEKNYYFIFPLDPNAP